jgi:hypothetical protein
MLVSENAMENPSNSGLTGRDRTLLDRARRNGYLDITRGSRSELLRAHGFWCWKLRIPLVSCQRNTPRSRFGSVRLDLFTTPWQLTGPAQAELGRLAPGVAAISPYDGVWKNVPQKEMEKVARAVYRIATRRGSYDLRPAAPSPALTKLIAALESVEALPKTA